VSLFSRNQEDHTGKFPDIIERLPGCVKPTTKEFIADGEVVAWDPENKSILPFQTLSTRKPKVFKNKRIYFLIRYFIERRRGRN